MNMQQINGMIRWFDSSKGEGLVRLDNGMSVYVHYTAIQGIAKNGYHYPNESDSNFLSTIKNRKVKVTLSHSQVETLVLLPTIAKRG